jgi:hypothetical protein
MSHRLGFALSFIFAQVSGDIGSRSPFAAILSVGLAVWMRLMLALRWSPAAEMTAQITPTTHNRAGRELQHRVEPLS